MVQFEIDIIFAHDRLQPRTYQSAAQNGSFLRCCPEFRTVLEFPPTSDVLATQFAPAAMNSKTHDALLCLARNPDDRLAIEFLYAGQGIGRPFVAPPDLPPDRLKMVRDAFRDTMRDPEFIADAKRNMLDVAPEDGEHLAALIQKVYATPKPIVDKIGELIK